MKIVGRQNHHTHLDCTLAPAEHVTPGETIVIETSDACYGLVRSVEDFDRYRKNPGRKSDPLTGPIYVKGAQPGAGLVVEILGIELDETGFQLIGPNRGVIREEVNEWDHYEVRIRDGNICLPRGLELPTDPMIGTLGNAPAGAPTNAPNPLGGNLDCPQIRPGASVHLPIDVEGALFFLGDVHARQGDGEVVGAPEIGARVTVRFQLLERPPALWPLVEDDESWHMITAGQTEEDAIRLGVFEMARFMQARYGVTFNDALVLLTMCVSLRCSRTGGHGALHRTICTSFSKKLIAKAVERYSRQTVVGVVTMIPCEYRVQ